MSGVRSVVHTAVQPVVEHLGRTSTGAETLLEGNGMNPVINIKVEFTKLGSFSYTSTEATYEPEPSALTPPYTFPKPVATQEPDAIVCLPSL